MPAIQKSNVQRGSSQAASSLNAAADYQAANPAAAGDVFDLPALLERFSGKRDFVVKLLTLFEREAVVHVNSILTAQAEAALPNLRAAAHSLKGAALNVSAGELSNLAAQLEKLAIEGKRDSLDEVIVRLKQQIGNAVAAVAPAIDRLKNRQ